MAQIDKPNLHFNTNLYTGNGSTQHSITGVGFQPDLVWIKGRGSTYNHFWFDAVRGVGKQIYSNATTAEGTNLNNLYSFDSDGFSLAQSGNDDVTNQNNINFASWNWKANGAGSANTDGSINTTATSVNTTAGFSICKWAGSGANATIGHGLGVAPKMIITKSLGTSAWGVYHESLGNTKVLFLDTTAAESANVAYWNNTSPTSSVFSVGTDSAVNHSGNDMIAYCFAEKKGYSKFGSYTGNGNADGTFVYTGFKPAFVLVKRYSGTEQWQMTDSVRDKDVSPNFARLNPDTTSAESTNTTWAKIEKFSNGFKLGGTDTVSNGSGSSYIYMAFAENPIVGSNNVAAVAR